MSDLSQLFEHRAHDFGFFQAVSLLVEFHRWRGDSSDPVEDGTIRFSAHPATTFPSSEVVACHSSAGRSQLELAFMGLLGASSPLPQYFADHAARHEHNGGPLRDFLDMFNSRLFALYYAAWRSHGGHGPGGSAGQSLHRLGQPGAAHPRSAAGLGELVSGLCDGAAVTVQEFVPEWVRVDDRAGVGAGARLGDNALLGRTVCDVSGAFRLHVGATSRELFEELAGESRQRESIRSAVQRYLDRPLTGEVVVSCPARAFDRVQPGTRRGRLGRSGVVGVPGAHRVLRTTFSIRS